MWLCFYSFDNVFIKGKHKKTKKSFSFWNTYMVQCWNSIVKLMQLMNLTVKRGGMFYRYGKRFLEKLTKKSNHRT